MAVFALPARRGEFFYSSILYSDPGKGNYHPCASVAELEALLRPAASTLYTRGCKPDPTISAKDPAWHFYSAQLIHYGLPFTKDKNAAKVRLLDAMNQLKLEVPAWVLKLEAQLKKEWEKENERLKRSKVTAGKFNTSSMDTNSRGQAVGVRRAVSRNLHDTGKSQIYPVDVKLILGYS